MQVTQEQIDPCKIALTISVEPERVEVARQKAFGQFARNIQIPGFRKGKVPPQMAKAYVDEGRVKQRAAEMLVEPAYAEALEETKLEPFAQAELELMEMPDDGSFVFKALVPLRPVVTLGPYKGLELERRRLEVTDADVERQLEQMQRRTATIDEVTDRPSQMGDIAVADLTVQIEGQETPELETPRATYIEIGKNIPDFDNGLVGMTVGEEKAIEAVYPADFPDENLRGKRATFTVKMNALRSRTLPELNDEFAKTQKVFPGLNTLDELKNELRTSLLKSAQEMAENELEIQLVGQIVRNSQVSFPDVMLRAEMELAAQELQERLQRENATLEQYLEAVGKTRDQVEQEMAQAADRRIRNTLALSEVAKAENIVADEADVEAELSERAEQAGVSPAAVRAFVEKNNQMEGMRSRALSRKVLGFLKAASHITDKVLTDAELRALQDPDGGELLAEGGPSAEATPAAEPLAVEQAVPKRRGKKAAAEEVES